MKKLCYFIVIVLIEISLYSQSIYNPFQSKFQNSLLDFNRFQFYNQISLFSTYNNKKSYAGGVYLSTLQYNISPSFISYLHIGKQYEFLSEDKYWNSPKDFLSGTTLIYNFSSTFNMGLEYGATPNLVNNFYGTLPTDYLHLWMEKKFGRNVNFKIEYYQMKK